MEEGLMDTLPRLEKRTQYLATLANVATLLRIARYHYRFDRGVYRGGIS